MPKLNLENPDTRNYMLEVAEYWISEFEIDGHRLDHAIGPLFNFWKDLIKLVKSYTYGTEVAFYNNSITRMKSRGLMNWSIANEKNNFFKKVKEVLSIN